MKRRPSIASAIAICDDCDWSQPTELNEIRQEAKKHAQKYHHRVTVESAWVVEYDFHKADSGRVEE